METSPELEAFLANPQLDPGAKASVLEEVTSGADPIVRNFVRLVASKGRAGQLGELVVHDVDAVLVAGGLVERPCVHALRDGHQSPLR